MEVHIFILFLLLIVIFERLQTCTRCGWLTPVNPSYSGCRDQDFGSKPVLANSSQAPISKKKKKSQKCAVGVTQVVDPEFKPQYRKKKKDCKHAIAPSKAISTSRIWLPGSQV
jgi:hypothetical protein